MDQERVREREGGKNMQWTENGKRVEAEVREEDERIEDERERQQKGRRSQRSG